MIFIPDAATNNSPAGPANSHGRRRPSSATPHPAMVNRAASHSGSPALTSPNNTSTPAPTIAYRPGWATPWALSPFHSSTTAPAISTASRIRTTSSKLTTPVDRTSATRKITSVISRYASGRCEKPPAADPVTSFTPASYRRLGFSGAMKKAAATARTRR